MTVPL